jgi:hypothetical protein
LKSGIAAGLSVETLRAQRSNPESFRSDSLDCFVASLLAMTMEGTSNSGQEDHESRFKAVSARDKAGMAN